MTSLDSLPLRECPTFPGEAPRKTATLFTLLVIMVMLMTGCRPGGENRAIPLQVGMGPWIGYETFHLARLKGDLDSHPVKLIEMANATDVTRAMQSGQLEAAALTLDEALVLRQYVPDLQVVMVINGSVGGDYLLARPEFTNTRQLKGKRIGVERSAVGMILLKGALEEAGMTFADVSLVNLLPEQWLTAYTQGEVDAVVAYTPFHEEIIARGARRLFDSRSIPDRILDVLVVTKKARDTYPQTLAHLINAHFSSVEMIMKNPGDASQLLGKRMPKKSHDEIIKSFQGVRFYDRPTNLGILQSKNSTLNAAALYTERVMVEQQLLAHPIGLQHLYTPDFLRK